jgi:hypothetical protein
MCIQVMNYYLAYALELVRSMDQVIQLEPWYKCNIKE